jgi:hypothetical protein
MRHALAASPRIAWVLWIAVLDGNLATLALPRQSSKSRVSKPCSLAMSPGLRSALCLSTFALNARLRRDQFCIRQW